MPWRTAPSIPRIDRLAILGGFVRLLETAFGCWAVVMSMAFAGLDITQPRGLAIAVAYLGGLPAYLLDGRSSRRIAVFLPMLCVLRLLTLGWRADVLLIPVTILLQRWKLRSVMGASAASRARGADEGTV